MPAVTFRLKHKRIEINPGFAVVVLMVCALMVKAGFWQLSRAEEKSRSQEEYRQAMQAEVIRSSITALPPETIRYRSVRLSGHYVNAKQFLLDNRIRFEKGGSRPGYHVITPFVTETGTVLVDRGWVSWSDQREQLPDVNVATGEREITVVVDVPGQGLRLGAMEHDEAWPRRIQFVDYALIGQRLDGAVYPALLVLAGERHDGFVENWKPAVEGPMKHYSYAAQWFLLTAAILLMFFRFSLKSETNNSGDIQ